MRTQTQGGKPNFIAFTVKNKEASASIPVGTPVLLNLSGTDDGLEVILPSSGDATKALTRFFGVVTGTIAAGQLGEVLIAGVARKANLVQATRAASSDSWATFDTLAADLQMSVDTVNNCFRTQASTTTVASNTTVTQVSPKGTAVFLAQTVASFSGLASATSDTRLVITTAVKAIVRAL